MTGSFTSAVTLEEAVIALGSGARPVAGGTDLVVGARQGKKPLPDDIVAIDRIDSLRELTETESGGGGGIRLGSLVSHEAIVASPAVRTRFTALADASAIVGSHATRAQGTIGGNVMNASPAMDTGGALLCFGATVTLRSAGGERTVPIGELWTGPGATSAGEGELLVAIDLPAASSAEGAGSAYVRLEYRRQMEIAVVGATAVVTVEGDRVSDARIAITALAPTIRRVADAEAALVDAGGGDEAVSTAARAAAAGSAPIGDVRASAEYRTAMAEVVARRAITGALARARGETVTIPASDALYGA